MKTLQITEQNARRLYKTASEEFKVTLEDTFGKELFSGEITDRVKTYEDACTELGISPINEADMSEAGFNEHEIAGIKLETIIKALNEGVTLDVYDKEVERWYPYFYPNGSPAFFAFGFSNYANSFAHAGSGSRLSLKSEELSDYCGRQFLELWKIYITK